MRGGSVVMDWDQIVRHLSVSSNEGQAYRLTDGTHSTFWQSSGTQGKVLASVHRESQTRYVAFIGLYSLPS